MVKVIGFKQYITEARMAPLYHATSIDKANKILASNVLIAKRGAPGEDPAVSFTRSLPVAFHHGEIMHGTKNDVVVLELDQQKLSQNYKIRPYQFWSHADRGFGRVNKVRLMPSDIRDDDMYNEFEERVVERNIRNLPRYLKSIIVYSNSAADAIIPKYKDIIYNYTTKSWVNK